MLSLRIALRYLFSRKSHSAVNIISLISLAGVATATLAVVCVLSVFNGFTYLAESRLSMFDPRLEVTRADGPVIVHADSLATIIGRTDGVAAALPTLTTQALAIYGERQMPVRIMGVPAGYEKITSLQNLIIDGEYVPPGDEGDGYTVPCYSCASLSIGVAVGLAPPTGFNGLLAICVPRRLGNINPAVPLGAFATDSVAVSSVFQVEQPEYDADLVLLPLEDVRALLDYDDEGTAIAVEIAPGADEAAVREALTARLGDFYSVKDRMQQQSHSFRMIQVEKWISFLLLAFILVIASFNIVSTLSILIIEKQQSIGIFTSLGAPRSLISRIFITEGWLISAGGGVIGIIAGVALCLAQQWWGFIKLSGDASQLTVTEYPVRVEAVDLLVVGALVAMVGLLASAVTQRFLKLRIKN